MTDLPGRVRSAAQVSFREDAVTLASVLSFHASLPSVEI